MFKSMLGFITGVILLYFSDKIINSCRDSLNYCEALQILSVFLVSCILVCFLFTKLKRLIVACWLFLSVLTGYLYAHHYLHEYHQATLAPEYEMQALTFSGYLCSLPAQGDYTLRALYCIQELSTLEGKKLPGKGFKIQLTWPLDMVIPQNSQHFIIEARQLHFTNNEEGFSPRNNFIYRGVLFKGRIQGVETSRLALPLNWFESAQRYFHQVRLAIWNELRKRLNNVSHAGVITALLLGDKSTLEKRHLDALNATGTQHLLAISGLHVGLVMLGLFTLLPKNMLFLYFVGVLGLAYVFLVGSPPSALRAWMMSLLVIIYLQGFIPRRPWRVYFLALFCVLLSDPLSVYSLGFWYSFLCVAIIFLLLPFLPAPNRKISLLILLQLFMVVALIPLSSFLSLRHGVENILANLFAIPWVTLLLLPLTFLWFVVGLLNAAIADVLLWFLNAAIELLVAFLASLQGMHFSLAIEPNLLIGLGFSVGLILLLCFLQDKRIFLSSLIILALVVLWPSRLYREEPEIVVFDVGQGLALALRSQDAVWLYDIGPAYKRFSNAQAVILPYLRRHAKANRLQGVIISHGDADHAGDLQSIFHEFSPISTWSGEPSRLKINGFEFCVAGMYWQDEHLSLEVLYPFPESRAVLDPKMVSANNRSCVLKINFSGQTWLVMGDVEGEAEFELVKHYRDQLKADVLVAGHHGSSNGTHYALLKHVQPGMVIFSAGYLNRFGHPAEEVLARIAQFNLSYYSTAKSGLFKTRLKKTPP